MNSDFILLNKTYQTIDFINKMVENYPKKETVIKSYIEKTLYEMVENLFGYNINETKRIKEKYLKDYIIKLSMINYLMYESQKKGFITIKQSQKTGKILLELKKISQTLLNGLDDGLENKLSNNS